jgi:hypothetical protein
VAVELCSAYLRYLWDDTDLANLFTGGNGRFEMLQSEPMPESHVYSWLEADPMPLGEYKKSSRPSTRCGATPIRT